MDIDLKLMSGNKIPVILQSEAADCGLACLAMVCSYYGYQTDMTVLRQRFMMSSHGISLRGMISIAGKLNLSSRALRVESKAINKLQLPCILHWDMNHFVILKKLKQNRVIIVDPAIGERSSNLHEFNQRFTGVALELSPTSKFKKIKEKRSLRLSQFWRRIIGLKRSLLQILLLSLLLQLFALAAPFYMQTVVDDVILRIDQSLLFALTLGFGLLLIIQIATTVLREWVVLVFSTRLNMQMSANLFRHFIRLPMEYFVKRHMGDIVSRFGSLENVRQLLTTGLVSTVVDGVLAILTLVAMLFYSLKLTLIVLAFVVIYALIRWLFYRPFRMLTEESIIANAKLESHFMESVRAMQVIKLFQGEDDRQNQWQNKLAESLNKGIHIMRWTITYSTINDILYGVENLLVTYFAAISVMDGAMSVGMLYAFMSYNSRFTNAMDSLIDQFIEIKMLELYLDRLADIVFTPVEELEPNNNLLIERGNQNKNINSSLIIEKLSFQYGETEKPVFKNVSFEVKAGQSLAIIGPSGCGKTTLIKCLMGLLKASDGRILIDGVSIAKSENYRGWIAGVMQDDRLISGSIKDNIACFSPEIDEQRIKDCAERASIHREIMELPMHYNTLVGDMDCGLSGGQLQRILLARALYRRPIILFLDESSSHLDLKNELLINEQIKKLPITRIIVAHRKETIAMADSVFDMSNMEVAVNEKGR